MKPKQAASSRKDQSYGNKLGYTIFQWLLQNLGVKWAYGLLVLIVPYYVLLRPSIYHLAKPYLQRRFPNDSFPLRYLRLFKYLFTFGKALIDQVYFAFAGEAKIKLEFEREAEILSLLERKPVIFLMSHLGFWEVSMAGAARFNKQLNVLGNWFSDRDKRQSFYDIKGKDFRLINVLDSYGGMIEATNALLRGEAVGLAGDRADQWRSQNVVFLGSPAQFPIIAQQLAVTTGASLISLLTYHEGPHQIRLCWKDLSTAALEDSELTKHQKVQMMLELYVRELETHLQKHPYLWFNFFDFWKVGKN